MRRIHGTLVCAVLTLAVSACAPKGGRVKLSEGERLTDKASEMLDDAEKALNEVDADLAERKLKEADQLLKNPRASNSPDWALLVERYKALEPRVGETRAEKARQAVAQRVEQRRAVIAKSVKTLRLAVVDLEHNPADRPRAEAVRRAAAQVESDIGWDRDLPAKDPEFKSYVDALKIDLQDAQKQLALADRAAEFAQGPARDHDEAAAIVARIRADKKLDARLAHLQEARQRYVQCNQRAASMIGANPGLEKSVIYVSGRPSTASGIAKSCDAQAKSLEKRIASLQKVLAKQAAKKNGKSRRQKSASR